MTCAMSGPSVPSPVTCWGAVNGTIAASAFEVACAGWGCAASVANDGSRESGQVVIAEADVSVAPVPRNVAGGNTTVVAVLVGNGAIGFGDGVGRAARFNAPRGVSLDGAGGLYVADENNQVIRRVELATREVTTVAGVPGARGRSVGATPLESTFYNPNGVEADATGNVYVADMFNHAVRMLSGAWVAGSTSGAFGFANAAAGTNATFDYPHMLRADVAGGLLYVADPNNYMVRTIAIAGTHTVATLTTFTAVVRDIALDVTAHVMYVAVSNSVYIVTYGGVSTSELQTPLVLKTAPAAQRASTALAGWR